jgi:hypothetical protein
MGKAIITITTHFHLTTALVNWTGSITGTFPLCLSTYLHLLVGRMTEKKCQQI